ncbi:MAG: ribosome-associated translation inhibitor RaiA [Gammaproteobacteria bacterium]|nr:ribosome-associated translation inhibitor RaiA [Gammaproteobacteria bacterium]MDE0225644.1 ribosome-associated translation inhibitor RaiA [Gammaproteobacteria bacterium]MDE0451980.1 ribosome-associated translation inhibitor RaiA [Gammaproteobacteria bacterium]
MQLNISGHHLEVTDAIRAYAENKIGRLERHYDHITNVRVVLSVDKLVQRAEATVHANGIELFASANDADLYAAIDALSNKLDRQVLKHKEKISDHRTRAV